MSIIKVDYGTISGGGLEALVPSGKYLSGNTSGTYAINDINTNGSNNVYAGVFFNISNLGIKRAKVTNGERSAFRCTAIKSDGTFIEINQGDYSNIDGCEWIVGGGYTYGSGTYYSTVDLSTSS